MNQPQQDDNPWRAMFLIGAIGTEIAVCVGGGFFLGSRFGRWAGNEMLFSLAGVLLGMAVGGAGAYYLIRRVIGGSDG